MQNQGGGGSTFHFPLRTHMRASGAAMGADSVIPYQSMKNWHWYLDDFNTPNMAAIDTGTTNPIWKLHDTSSAGTPTFARVANTTGGVFQMKLAATSEAETVGIYTYDDLTIQGNLPFYFETRINVVHTMAANQVVIWGLISAFNATFDSTTRNAIFRLDADADLLIETDDDTTNLDDKDTGWDVVANTYYTYSIERGADGTIYFRRGETDGKNVKTWTMKRLDSSLSDPSFGANNLQPVFAVQKASGTTTPEMLVDYAIWAGQRV